MQNCMETTKKPIWRKHNLKTKRELPSVLHNKKELKRMNSMKPGAL